MDRTNGVSPARANGTTTEKKATGRARKAAARGATALAPAATPHDHRHPVGSALRAVKVFAGTAFSVAVLGEYADDR